MSSVALLAAALALPGLSAWALARALLPAPPRTPLATAGAAAIAAVAGQGLASLLAFGWLLGGGALDRSYVVADALALVAIAAVALRIRRRTVIPAPAPTAPRVAGGRWLAVAAVVLLVLALASFLLVFYGTWRRYPHGHWDAWAIWNLRARFLLRAGPAWRTAFAPDVAWAHPEYPLLVPLAVARAWAWAGPSTLAPASIAAVFTVAAPLVLAAAVSRRAGVVAGATAALLLLGTHGLRVVGAAQYADLPVATLLLAALAMLDLARDERPGRARARAVALAGLLLGLAGWTKNEGLVVACAAILSHVALPGQEGRRAALRDLVAVAAGAALPAVAWLVFHAAVASAVAPELAQPGAAVLRKLANPGRWRAVAEALWAVWPGRDASVGAVAIGLALLLGARPGRLVRTPAFLAALLVLAAYAVVYVTTPRDLVWHLSTSAERLLLHVWPSALLGLFAAVPATPPGEGAPVQGEDTPPRGDATPPQRAAGADAAGPA